MTNLEKRILVVDDEVHITQILKELLEMHDHNVDTASNGAIAFEKIQESNFDLVISDVKMPICDGEQLLKLMQDLQKRPKVIMLTGHSQLTKQDAMELGAETLIEKPYDVDELLIEISKLLD